MSGSCIWTVVKTYIITSNKNFDESKMENVPNKLGFDRVTHRDVYEDLKMSFGVRLQILTDLSFQSTPSFEDEYKDLVFRT